LLQKSPMRDASCATGFARLSGWQPVGNWVASAANFPASLLPVGVTPTTSRRIARRRLRRKWPEAERSRDPAYHIGRQKPSPGRGTGLDHGKADDRTQRTGPSGLIAVRAAYPLSGGGRWWRLRWTSAAVASVALAAAWATDSTDSITSSLRPGTRHSRNGEVSATP
jgi:hypothetical protein